MVFIAFDVSAFFSTVHPPISPDSKTPLAPNRVMPRIVPVAVMSWANRSATSILAAVIALALISLPVMVSDAISLVVMVLDAISLAVILLATILLAVTVLSVRISPFKVSTLFACSAPVILLRAYTILFSDPRISRRSTDKVPAVMSFA